MEQRSSSQPSPVASWRRELPTLVVDAQALGAIGVIRSLGRAGYPVHACASRPDALGLRSRYASSRAVCPRYEEDAFLPWLRGYVQQHGIRAIVPSEGLLLALRPVFPKFIHLLPVSKDEAVVYAGMSKCDVFEILHSARSDAYFSDHLVPSVLVWNAAGIPDVADLEALGEPLYIKTDACHGIGHRNGGVDKVESAREARLRLEELAPRFERILVQGHVPGQGVGVFFLLWDGRVIAEFMHRRLHEVPHTGGVSSLRESWWHGRIRDDALAKLRHLKWHGVAMMEYRWDARSERFHLLEMNGRFWGSLHLALYAGIDFPVLLLDAFHGRLVNGVNRFDVGIRCRHTFPKEIEYVWSRVKDREVSPVAKLGTIIEAVELSVNPWVYADLMFPGDRRLYWINLRRCLRGWMK